MLNIKNKVLIVDDMEINRLVLSQILSDTYDIEEAEDGKEAITKLMNSDVKPDLLLLDIVMPQMNGLEVIEYMKSEPSLSNIPVILITSADQEKEGLSTGADDYVAKPFDAEIVKLRASHQIELYQYRNELEKLVDQKANELIETKEVFLDVMANLIEHRSLESGEHVKRTKELSRILIQQLIYDNMYLEELLSADLRTLINAVPLHDIGKIGIPDNILLKPGRLTADEFDIMKTHSAIGGEVIQSMALSKDDEYLKHAYDICRYHHERWDGNGYPCGLSGTEIPLSARVVAVVDVYDALVSERCYKMPLPHSEAMEILEESSGSHFDPALIKSLKKVENEFFECVKSINKE
ncbi:MAG: response regulator [Oscillospiraceae bacterium]|nr:response regulator [Oscillospiraceae bacterium]